MAQRKLRDIMSGPGRRTEKQKMLAGELYEPRDPELQAVAAAAKARMVRYLARSPRRMRTSGRSSSNGSPMSVPTR